MRKITQWTIKYRYAVLAFFAVAVAINLFLSTGVSVNFDMAKYLPEDSMTKRAITAMEAEFGNPGTAEVMVENVTVAQALADKAEIEQIDGVQRVIWLDDAADVTQPVSMIPEATRDNYYKKQRGAVYGRVYGK